MFDAREYESIRKDFLNSEDMGLTVVKDVQKLTRKGNEITFICQGKDYRKDLMEALFVQEDSALVSEGTTTTMTVKLKICTPSIVRVQLAEGENVPENATPMVINDFKDPVEFELFEDEVNAEIKTRSLRIVVRKSPWNLSIFDIRGRLLYKQYTEDTHSISHIVKEQGEQWKDSYCGFECFPFGIAMNFETGEKYVTNAAVLDHKEHFYGFGEKFGPLDKLGHEVTLWHVDALSVSTAKSYKNIPFYMSTNGYGIFINSGAKTKYLMGSYHYKTHSFIVMEETLDFYFIAGETFKDILPQYTDITGKPPMLPKWSFGLWLSKNSYRTRAEVLEAVELMRQKEIPCDVIHIDVSWFKEEWQCDYEFDEVNFPNPKEMIEILKEKGFRLSLWQLPYIKQENKIYKEAAEEGYFAKNRDGSPAVYNTYSIIDFSNPEAVKWYKNLLRKLFNLGVSVIKTDFGESAVEDAVYHGYDGKIMHNLYPLIYNQAAYETTKEETGDGIVWGRSAYAGSQRYPLNWGGDAGTDFHGLYHSLRGGLSLGMSGFPFWSHDIGGYFCEVEPEVYIRWAQVGLFSSHARLHGTTPREPWAFGEEIENIFRKYAVLRYRLLPYIFSTAHHCTDQSLPMLRSLVLEYQDDPTVYGIDDQYLFGESFLVAPVLSRCESRKIYLPKGIWFDYWTKKEYQGSCWISYQAPLDTLPLFVKGGSLIPMGPEMSHVDEKPLDTLTLDIYPEGNSSFEMIDGSERTMFTSSSDGKEAALNISPSSRNYVCWFNNICQVSSVKINNTELRPISKGSEELSRSYYIEDDCLVVYFTSKNSEVNLRISIE